MKRKFSCWLITGLLLTGLSSVVTVASAQPGQAQANGIQLTCESFGPKNAETFLLISGTGTQLTMWPVELCEQLVQRGYRVIRFDNRDIALSTKMEQAGQPDWAAISKALQTRQTPPLPYTLDDMATDAVGLLDADRVARLQTIKVPTIVIHGSDDPLVVVDAGRDVAEQIPGASFQLIKGMGHSIPTQLAPQLADLLTQNAAKATKK